MFFSFFRVFVFLLYGQLSGCDLVSHHDLACILLTLMVLDISSHAVWPSVYLLWSKVCSDVFLLLYRWVLPFCCQICNIHFGPPHCFLSSCLFSQGKYTFLRAHLLISVSLSSFFSLSTSLSLLTSTSRPCKNRSEETTHHSSTGNKFEIRFSTNVFCHSHPSWMSSY